MKVRKKEIKVPKNFFVSRWRIPIFYGDIGDFLEGVVSEASKGIGVHRGS